MSYDEEYILDIKIEINSDNLIYSPVNENDFNSNCSTLTASEVEGTISASESRFKQKKLRVLIEKLPQNVLDHYFGSKVINSSMSASRVSTRVRTVPKKYASTEIDIAHASKPGRYTQVMDISKNTKKSLTQTKSHNQETKSLGISKNSLTISKPIRPSYLNALNKTSHQTPPTVTNKIDAVKGDPSTVLVIRQPVLKSDPLNIPPCSEQAVDKVSTQLVYRGIDKETETEEVTDAEFINEPEVIKRIYFASKSAQTKFTCNGSICGLVDSEFDLTCFYCYKIFPLHLWLDFMRHVQIQHHVEGKPFRTHESIKEFSIAEHSPKISSLKIPEASRIKAKLPEDLDLKTSKPETFYISNQDILNLYKPVKKKTVVKLIEVAKNSPSKTHLTTNQLNQSNDKSLPPKASSNSQLNQSKYCVEKSSLPKKPPTKKIPISNQLQEPKEFVDLSSDNEISKVPSVEDLNTSYVDEIISLGDDDNTVVEDFYLSDDLQVDNNKNVSKSSSPKLVTLKNPNTNPNEQGTIILPPTGNLPISKTSVTSPASSQSRAILKKAYIKLPSNLSIEEVLKTLPKPTSTQNSTSSTKPRYFVVKKVTKQAKNEKKTNIDLSKDIENARILSAWPKNSDDDDMPSNDDNEDEVPKSTNGCGILFGLTNRAIVVEFLIKLKTYPELWRPHLNNASIDYDDSIQQLCLHLNEKYDLNINDFEMRLSIQRVKDWYCRMLKKIYVYNQDPNNVEPYKHTFPEYFEILNKFLTSDAHDTKNRMLRTSFKETNTSIRDYPKWMVYKPGQTVQNISPNCFVELNKPNQIPKANPRQKKPIIRFKPSKLPEDNTSQNVIEFDAETLYAVDSSDESLILPTDSKPKKPKGTKTYNPLVPFVCDICKRLFKRNTDLNRHRNTHFPPKYKCSTCSRMFNRKNYAEKCSHPKSSKSTNFSNSSKSTNFSNSSKSTIFSNSSKSTNFSKSSTFRWICEICGMSYRSMGSLNSHKNAKHLNQRLKCGICKFTALTNYRIVQHQIKRHVVEPGTVEEIAKKCKARTDSKTPFTPEARQEFLWRREMRKKLPPGVKFHGCCKCRINFNSRKEKLLHNKLEHPIKDNTVICLLCQPKKMLLSNSNSVRRHYTDMHKVPWDEIDDLVKRTKPIFKLLSKDEIEHLNSSENYTEVLNDIIIKRNINVYADSPKEEPTNEINQQLMTDQAVEDTTAIKCSAVESVYVDGIIDHDYEHDDNEPENQEYVYDHNEVDNDENLNKVEQTDIVIDNQHIIYNEDGTIILYQNNNDEEEINVDDNGYDLEHESELVGCELVEESIVEEEFIEVDAEFVEADAEFIEEFVNE